MDNLARLCKNCNNKKINRCLKKMKVITNVTEEMPEIFLKSQPVKQVKHFKYLASTVSFSGKTYAEIESKSCPWKLTPLLKKHQN